jgi:hypothetical protein
VGALRGEVRITIGARAIDEVDAPPLLKRTCARPPSMNDPSFEILVTEEQSKICPATRVTVTFYATVGLHCAGMAPLESRFAKTHNHAIRGRIVPPLGLGCRFPCAATLTLQERPE